MEKDVNDITQKHERFGWDNLHFLTISISNIPGPVTWLFYFVSTDVETLQFTRLTDMKIQSHIVMPSGDVLKLDCKATGTPPIRYSWYKDGKILLARCINSIASLIVNDRHDLILKDLVPSDSATYTCKVENNIKVIQHNFRLTVQGKVLFFRRRSHVTVPYCSETKWSHSVG